MFLFFFRFDKLLVIYFCFSRTFFGGPRFPHGLTTYCNSLSCSVRSFEVPQIQSFLTLQKIILIVKCEVDWIWNFGLKSTECGFDPFPISFSFFKSFRHTCRVCAKTPIPHLITYSGHARVFSLVAKLDELHHVCMIRNPGAFSFRLFEEKKAIIGTCRRGNWSPCLTEDNRHRSAGGKVIKSYLENGLYVFFASFK